MMFYVETYLQCERDSARVVHYGCKFLQLLNSPPMDERRREKMVARSQPCENVAASGELTCQCQRLASRGVMYESLMQNACHFTE